MTTVCPLGWIEVRLGDISKIKTGTRNNQDKTELGRYPFFVRSSHVERIDSYSYDCEAILIPGEGGIGSIFHYTNGKFEVHQRVYKISDLANGISVKFIYYYMSHFFEEQAVRNSVKATVDSLRLPTFKNFSIVLPADIREQQAIADALTNADSVIASLERLITKKQAIKQGMMQELLTGRTRLPGFDGEWNDVSLGSIAMVTMGQSPVGATYNSDNHGIPLVQGNADIRDRATFDRVWTTAPTKLCKRGDVILTVRAPVGYTAIASKVSCLGRGVCALSTKADNRFLFHALVYVEPSWALYEQGSTFTAINSKEVRSFMLRWPADADERSTIAHALDDADDELRKLELCLDKARAIKQGMMQELLTGRTRLPVRETVA